MIAHAVEENPPKKWGPIVAEKKSLRVMHDNRTAQEKVEQIKKIRNLEDAYPTKQDVGGYQGDYSKDVEMLHNLESNVYGGDGGSRPMVQLLGGSAQDPFVDRLLKKIKLGLLHF